MVASAGGMIVAGLLVSVLGWRGPYPCTALIVGICAILGTFLLPASRPPVGQSARIDVPGIVLVTASSSMLVWSLSTIGSKGLGSPPLILAALAAGLVLLTGFILLERRTAFPLIPSGMLRKRRVMGGMFVASVVSGTAACMIVLVSLALQRGLGQTPIEVGYVLAPFGLASFVLGFAMRWLSAPLASHVRPGLLLALGLIMAAMLMMAAITGTPARFAYTIPIVMISCGSVIGLAVAMGEIYAGIEPDEKGIAAALCYVARLLFGAVAVAFAVGTVALDAKVPGALVSLDRFTIGYRIVAGYVLVAIMLTAWLFRPARVASGTHGSEAEDGDRLWA